MNFDRNTIIGFIVLAILFIGYFFYTSSQQRAYMQEKAIKDSIELAKKASQPIAPTKVDTSRVDSLPGNTTAIRPDSVPVLEKLTEVETPLLKIAFTSKGGQPKWVELKKFKGPDSSNVRLASTEFDQLNYKINIAPNQTADIVNEHFQQGQIVNNQDGTKSITYQLALANGSSITHHYVIKPDDYMVDFNIQLNGVNQVLSGNSLNLIWQARAVQLQKDLSYEKQMSDISYYTDGDFDYSSAASSDNEKFDKTVKWVAVKQQFFNTSLIAKDKFNSGTIDWTTPASGNTIVEAVATMKIDLPSANAANIPLAFYYGPNDYKQLKKYGMEMEDMVNLGTGIFAFVKYINRWIVLPAFDLFRKVTSNYGIVILLLTLFIRLLISPLTYKSYLSGAKMKVLRPEIEQLKAKYGNDQQQISMEQMKLFREAGVNPLGGCIPALFQIPIFFALYSFFNSNVSLRGQGFLWADDLSQYDSIAQLPFSIPFYGDHVSLFTITATLTSFLISIYSMSMTPDQSNPVLKWMPYIFPIILLFVFNSQPAALTWYYTVSNIITLVLQFIIQNYIIDHEKILAKMEENKKKPKKVSKWQERMAQMQEQQKKMQQMQQKGRK